MKGSLNLICSKKTLLTILAAIFSACFCVAATPVITSFSPSSGAVGTTVTITGTGFNTTAAGNIVFFGATQATVSAASATSLTVTVPLGATYNNISVLNTSNSLSCNSLKPFVVTFTGKSALTVADFQPYITLNPANTPRSIAAADFDGDGKPDIALIAVNSSNVGTLSIFRNISTAGSLSTSSFAAKVDFAGAGNCTYITTADMDGDGKLDVIVANGSGNTVSIFRNTSTTGNISFANKVDYLTNSNGTTVKIADLDGDGKPDMVIPNNGFGAGNTVSILRNTSITGTIDATSFATKVDLPANTAPYGLSIGDIDGDGKPDLVVTTNSATGNTVSVYQNTSVTGSINLSSFASKVDFTTGSTPYGVVLGDFDGDGKLDMATANSGSNTVSFFRNTSASGTITTSSFAAKVDVATNAAPRDIVVSDVDGDGLPDVITGDFFVTSATMLRNISTGSTIAFSPRVDFTVGSRPIGVVLCDFDGDGKPDLATCNNVSLEITILRNNPLNPSSAITFSNTTGTSTTASWTSGNAASRAVFLLAGSTGSPAPVNNTTYTGNAAFKSGTQIGSSGWYCVYNGSGNSVNITGLTSGTTYRLMVLEYNGTAGSELYLTASATNNPNNVVTQTVYYTKSTGDLSSLATYGTSADGSGSAPTDFNGSGKSAVYQLSNRSSYVLTTSLTLGSTLNIPASSTLDLAGNTLILATLSGTGTITGSNTSSLVINGTITGLSFATGQEKLKNLTLGNSASLTLSSFLAIASTGTVTLAAGATLNTNNTLTLRSDILGSAQIAALGTGASISGGVTVERYLADKRAWRLVSPSVYSSQTINTAWQEGAGGTLTDPNPGYGTFIAGSTAGNGFDIAGSTGSLLAYNGTAFNTVTNTNATALNLNPAYFLFSLGSRGVNPATAGVHSATTLRSYGTVLTGTVSSSVTASGYTLVGNPYPAPVDFAQVTRSATVPNQFYTWDIKLGTYGGYVLVSYNGTNYTSVPTSPSGLSNIIPAGAAIFVQSDGSNTGTITVNESSKAGTGNGTFSNFATSVSANNQHDFRINLTDANLNLVDGVMATFSASYSNNVDYNDAPKLDNFYENIALTRSGKLLSLERRSTITTKDTIFIHLSGTNAPIYQLQIDPQDFNEPNLSATLEDNYLHTSTKLKLGQVSNLTFSCNTDTASFMNRFKITFAPLSTINTVSVQIPRINARVIAYPNPVTGKQINLTFDGIPSGSYNITVINTFGQILQKSSMIYDGSTSNKIIGADYNTGVYTVNIQSPAYHQSIKVIVP